MVYGINANVPMAAYVRMEDLSKELHNGRLHGIRAGYLQKEEELAAFIRAVWRPCNSCLPVGTQRVQRQCPNALGRFCLQQAQLLLQAHSAPGALRAPVVSTAPGAFPELLQAPPAWCTGHQTTVKGPPRSDFVRRLEERPTVFDEQRPMIFTEFTLQNVPPAAADLATMPQWHIIQPSEDEGQHLKWELGQDTIRHWLLWPWAAEGRYTFCESISFWPCCWQPWALYVMLHHIIKIFWFIISGVFRVTFPSLVSIQVGQHIRIQESMACAAQWVAKRRSIKAIACMAHRLLELEYIVSVSSNFFQPTISRTPDRYRAALEIAVHGSHFLRHALPLRWKCYA